MQDIQTHRHIQVLMSVCLSVRPSEVKLKITFLSLPLVVHNGPQDSPKAPPRLPQGSPKAPPRLLQDSPKTPSKLPQGFQRLPQGFPRLPKAPQRLPKGSSKGSSKVPQRCLKGSFGFLWVPLGSCSCRFLRVP